MNGDARKQRRLGLSGIALTKQRSNRHEIAALKAVRDRLEAILVSSGYFSNAPFYWVTIAIRYGLVDADSPEFQRINAKYGDLPLAIEVDSSKMQGATADCLERLFESAVLRALIHAAQKYEIPVAALERRSREISSAPN